MAAVGRVVTRGQRTVIWQAACGGVRRGYGEDVVEVLVLPLDRCLCDRLCPLSMATETSRER